MKTETCPTEETLQGYIFGNVDDTIAIATESHVNTCSECQSRLEAFMNEADPMVEQLRSLRSDSSSQEQTVSVSNLSALIDTSVSLQANRETINESLADDDIRALFEQNTEYVLTKRIGAGGMGEVWRGIHRKLQKDVAIKMIRHDRKANKEFVERFLREMRTIGSLDHPHVVRATDAGELNGVLYLVMEFIDGIDVGKLARSRGGLPVKEAAEIIRQAALGLDHIHQQGILHRDLKPSNLMLTKAGTVKILDAGLARWQESEREGPSLTGSGNFIGTPDYMSPEQWTEPDRLTPASDIYSLGCTLYCLLKGHAPFATEDCSSIGKKMDAHCHAEIPHLTEIENLQKVAPLLNSMLEKQPRQRPASAQHVAEACRAVGHDSDLTSLLSPSKRAKESGLDRQVDVSAKQTVVGESPQANVAANADRFAPPRTVTIALGFLSFAILATIVVIVIIRNNNDVLDSEPGRKNVESALSVFPNPDQPKISTGSGYGLIQKLSGHTDTIRCIVFTKNGDLISSSDDNTVRQWSGEGWQEQRELEDCGGVRTLVVSHSGQEVYGIGMDGKVYGWDLETGKLIMKLAAHEERGAFLDISPNDSMLLSSAKDGTVKLWDLSTQEEIWSLPGHTPRVGEVRFNPGMVNGEYVLTADVDGLHYWNVETKTKVRSYPGRRRAIFTPDGKKFLAGSTAPGVAYLRQLELDDPIHEFSNFEHVVRSFSMSPTGEFACVGLHDGSLRIWNLVGGNETIQIWSPTFCTNEVAISRDGERVAFGGGCDPLAKHQSTPGESGGDKGDYAIRVWRLPDVQPKSTLTPSPMAPRPSVEADADLLLERSPDQSYGLVQKLIGHQGRIDSFLFLPNGDLVSTSVVDGTTRHWDVKTGNELGRFESPASAVREIVVSNSGRSLYGIDSGGMICGWDLQSRQLMMHVKGHDDIGLSIDISPDDSMLISSAKDGRVKLWDTSTQQQRGELPGHTTRVRNVRFNPGFPNSDYALTADDGRLRYWNVRTELIVKSFAGRRTAAFTPDGKSFLAGSSAPGVAFLQQLDADEPAFKFGEFSGVVRRFAMAPNGRYSCVGLQDKTLRIWDLATGRETLKINNPTNGSIEVAVSHDSQLIAFGSGYDELARYVPGASKDAHDTGDYSIRIWKLPSRQDTAD